MHRQRSLALADPNAESNRVSSHPTGERRQGDGPLSPPSVRTFATRQGLGTIAVSLIETLLEQTTTYLSINFETRGWWWCWWCNGRYCVHMSTHTHTRTLTIYMHTTYSKCSNGRGKRFKMLHRSPHSDRQAIDRSSLGCGEGLLEDPHLAETPSTTIIFRCSRAKMSRMSRSLNREPAGLRLRESA